MRPPRSKRLFIYCAGSAVNGVPVLTLEECLERFGPEEGGF